MVKKSKKRKARKNVVEKFAGDIEKGVEKEDREMHVGRTLKARENKQLIWFLVIIGLVFVIFLGTYFYVQSLKTFEYVGVGWVREDLKGLTLYHGRFPIIYKGVLYNYYNLYLRNDPRKNDAVIEEGLEFKFYYPEVIVTNRANAAACRDAARVTADISAFLSVWPSITNVSGAVVDEELAEEWGLPFADCTTAVNKTVILIQKSVPGSLSIAYPNRVDNKNCYIISIGECENAKAIEKFMIGMLAYLNDKEI